MNAQPALPLYPPTDADEMHAVLTDDWQDLDDLATTSRIQWNPWTAATRLVREHRAQHRIINGCDHYRLPTTEAT